MKRIHRLGRGEELNALFRRGQRIHSPLFQVTVRATTLPYDRFVFVASRSVDKRAVVRNRLRRRAREYIRKEMTHLLPSRDIAITIKKEAAAAGRQDLYAALRQILARI